MKTRDAAEHFRRYTRVPTTKRPGSDVRSGTTENHSLHQYHDLDEHAGSGFLSPAGTVARLKHPVFRAHRPSLVGDGSPGRQLTGGRGDLLRVGVTILGDAVEPSPIPAELRQHACQQSPEQVLDVQNFLSQCGALSHSLGLGQTLSFIF